MKKSPAGLVGERFESKNKLVEAIQKFASSDFWLDRVSPKKGLERVANSKLLRLHGLFSAAQERFGTRAKLIDAILELEKRGKDAGYKQRLEGYPLPRLLDLHGSLSKRSGRAEAKAKAKAEPKVKAAAKKAPVKKAAAKKAPAKKAAAKKAPAKKAAAKKGARKR